jgi:raffinose/stachyose/melibiose transport system substrate-binding protein
MGHLVKAGLLLPLDGYADAYHWRDRVSENVLSVSSWSPDGKEFGSGNLYGYTTMGELVGVYYNKRILEELGLQLPTTMAEFQQDLEAAKQAGQVPIQFGNNDAWPGIHEFSTIQDQSASVTYLTDLIFGAQRDQLSFDTPENLQAATTLQDWANAGYFTPGFGGGGYDDAVANFVKGQGLFMITGNWIVANLGADNRDFGFFLMPANAGDPPVATGGAGYPLSIAAGSEHPDAAAAYIDWMTSNHASDLLVPTGQLPLANGVQPVVEQGTVLADVIAAASTASGANGIVPYEDWATPTFYDTLTAAIQELMVNRITPEQFNQQVQADYQDFQSSRA